MATTVKQRHVTVGSALSPRKFTPGGSFLVNAEASTDLNKNTSWFTYPGVWTMYILIVLLVWVLLTTVLGLTMGMAWTVVHLIHFVVTYYFFHWKKGSPFSEDQGVYDKLTWWEQVDSGKQLTRNRKFLTAVPALLYLLACHTNDYTRNPLFYVNTLAVIILIVAKLPSMHKVRILGINADYPT